MKNLRRLMILSLLCGFNALAVDPYFMPETFPKTGGMALVSNISGCSASLIAFDDSKETDKVLVLTNGHCSGEGTFFGMYPDADDIFVKKSADTTDVYFYSKNANFVTSTTPARLVYATMKRLDIAVFELKETYADFKKMRVTPLILSRKADLKVGEVYVAASSYWKQSYQCRYEGLADVLVEEPWTWEKSLRFSPENCLAQEGMSGSPMLNGKNEVVALLNTAYMGGEPCTLMNPCEKNGGAKSPQVFENATYALPAWELYNCRDQNGEFDPAVSSCTLPK